MWLEAGPPERSAGGPPRAGHAAFTRPTHAAVPTRPLPPLHHTQTELCRAWVAGTLCQYGDRCQFAHGATELRPAPARTRPGSGLGEVVPSLASAASWSTDADSFTTPASAFARRVSGGPPPSPYGGGPASAFGGPASICGGPASAYGGPPPSASLFGGDRGLVGINSAQPPPQAQATPKPEFYGGRHVPRGLRSHASMPVLRPEWALGPGWASSGSGLGLQGPLTSAFNGGNGGNSGLAPHMHAPSPRPTLGSDAAAAYAAWAATLDASPSAQTAQVDAFVAAWGTGQGGGVYVPLGGAAGGGRLSVFQQLAPDE